MVQFGWGKLSLRLSVFGRFADRFVRLFCWMFLFHIISLISLFSSSEWNGWPLYFRSRFWILIPVFSRISRPSCPVTLHSTRIVLFAAWSSSLIFGESGLQ